MIEFKMPSLGADMEAGTLVEWLVKPGVNVKRGDIIAVVDTQKGLIDIEVFDEGIIRELVIKENQKVPVGTVMALLESAKEATIKDEKPLFDLLIAAATAMRIFSTPSIFFSSAVVIFFAMALSTSSFVIASPSPVPFIVLRSIPFSDAILFARGDALMPCGVSVIIIFSLFFSSMIFSDRGFSSFIVASFADSSKAITVPTGTF